MSELKENIIDLINNSQSINFVYLQVDRNGENRMHGDFSDQAALKFLKHLALERPAAYREFKKWNPE